MAEVEKISSIVDDLVIQTTTDLDTKTKTVTISALDHKVQELAHKVIMNIINTLQDGIEKESQLNKEAKMKERAMEELLHKERLKDVK